MDCIIYLMIIIFIRCWYCECFDGKLGKTIDEAKLCWNIAVENYNKTKEEN